jgi:L-threonylcarbamoyladenylate synthase
MNVAAGAADAADAMDAGAIELGVAAQRLAEGGLVAFATETVYGLGARADDDAAVACLYAAKGRPRGHPLIVHVGDPEAARRFAASIGADAARLIDTFWPGPLSLVLPRRPGVAEAAAAGLPTIALRMPSHPLALALLRAAADLGVPGVAAPSANRFGRVSPTTAAHVRQEFGGAVPVLDGGPCEVGIESVILDAVREPPALLRPGALGAAAIEAALGHGLRAAGADAPRASGSLASHYAPEARVRLFADGPALAAALAAGGPGETRGVYSRRPFPGLPRWRPMPAGPAATARELFAALRGFDAEGATEVWVEAPPAHPDWAGVADRLRRAAALPEPR